MSYKIVPTQEHYTIYINGDFYCTADTWSEAVKEIEDYKREINYANA